MKKDVEKDVAIHEAGHVFAYYMLDKKFIDVSIIPNDNSLGRVRHRKEKSKDEFSFSNPLEFHRYFHEDIINIAGVVAGKIFTGRYNHTGAGSDYETWVDKTLLGIANEKLVSIYQKFLFQYVKDVFSIEVNWIRINAIAEALVKYKTLNYKEFLKIMSDSVTQQVTEEFLQAQLDYIESLGSPEDIKDADYDKDLIISDGSKQ